MVAESTWIFVVAILIVVFSLVALGCNEDLRRQTPANFIFLSAFTIAESFLLGVAACRYAPMEIFMAVLITASVCLDSPFCSADALRLYRHGWPPGELPDNTALLWNCDHLRGRTYGHHHMPH